MRYLRVFGVLSAVVFSLAAVDANAASVVDTGRFRGASQGLTGCFVDEFGSPYRYCFLAYNTGAAGASPVRLLGWELYSSTNDTSGTPSDPQRWADGAAGAVVDSVDVTEPATALQAGGSGITLSADVADTDFGHVSISLDGSSGVATSSAQVFDGTGALPNIWARTSGSDIDESPCLSGCHDVASAANAPDLIGTGWFWSAAPAAGGWDFIPGELPTMP